MTDPKVNKWIQKGMCYLWRYRDRLKDYPGWNVSFNKAGRESIKDLLMMMKTSQWSCKKKIEITRPPFSLLVAVGKRGGHASWVAPRWWQLQLIRENVPENYWAVTFNETLVQTCFGYRKLEALYKIVDILPDLNYEVFVDSDSEDSPEYFTFYFWQHRDLWK